MIRIIADDNIPFLRGVLEPFAKVYYLPGNKIDREKVSKSDALLVRTRTKCTPELLEGTPVKFIGTATIGYDHIDTGYCDSNNIKWSNAPGCNSSSVQQYIASALLRMSAEAGFELKGKTIGIVGVGNVGSKVQAIAEALGMNVLLNDPPRARKENKNAFVSLDNLLRESDIITLHVPLNLNGQDKTYHLFSGETFRNVKKGCWLINTSRGEVVDNESLKNALAEETIAGTILDVWVGEPDIDIPLMHMAFLATPHIAGYSADGKANGTSMVVNDLCKSFNFPLTGWYPADIPPAADPFLAIDCNGKTSEEILRKAVFHTYNILEDDIRLRFDPTRFEKERENYPVRREFTSYTIDLKDGDNDTRELLKSFGFRIAK